MMVYSHTLFGLSCWAGVVYWSNHFSATEMGGWVAVTVGSLLPDLDHPKSFLGRRLPFISIPLSRWVGHRGLTHSFILIAFFVLLGYFALSSKPLDLAKLLKLNFHWIINPAWWVALSVGYLSHLLGDWLTVGGIPLLWPYRERFRAPLFFATGQSGEYLVDFGLLIWLYWWSTKTFPHAFSTLDNIIKTH